MPKKSSISISGTNAYYEIAVCAAFVSFDQLQYLVLVLREEILSLIYHVYSTIKDAVKHGALLFRAALRNKAILLLSSMLYFTHLTDVIYK